MLQAEFIQDCSNGTPLLEYYAEREHHLRNAGRAIKKAIADSGVSGFFPFNMKNLNSPWFTVQRMNYQNELYAIVTNSAINYIFKIIEQPWQNQY